MIRILRLFLPKLSFAYHQIRALTRDPSKSGARDLLKYGSNIVLQECDLTSRPSLAEALKGAYGFYAVTNYFARKIEKEEDNTEEEDAKLMADTAKACGIKHYVWSTLPEYKEFSAGKWPHIHHFDGKHRMDSYVEKLGFDITSYVVPSCYMQNFIDSSSRRVYTGNFFS